MDRLQSKHAGTVAGRRVLLFGREPFANEATERFLQYCGHNVILALDSKRAVRKADRLKPQVLVCDVSPNSGSDRVCAARRIQEKHNTTLVLITNYHRIEVRQRFPELDVADHLRKPISLSVLADSVSRVPVPP